MKTHSKAEGFALQEILSSDTLAQAFTSFLETFSETLANKVVEKASLKISLLNETKEEHWSTKQVCIHYNVTRQTVSNWTKKGLLKLHRIGAKIYYIKSEVLLASLSLEKYRRGNT